MFYFKCILQSKTELFEIAYLSIKNNNIWGGWCYSAFLFLARASLWCYVFKFRSKQQHFLSTSVCVAEGLTCWKNLYTATCSARELFHTSKTATLRYFNVARRRWDSHKIFWMLNVDLGCRWLRCELCGFTWRQVVHGNQIVVLTTILGNIVRCCYCYFYR